MDIKFKNNKREILKSNRQSLLICPENRKISENNTRFAKAALTTRETESSKYQIPRSKPITKSSSQTSADINLLFKNTRRVYKENVDNLSKITDQESNSQISSKHSSRSHKLYPIPFSLSQLSTRFYQNLCKVESKLTNFYVNPKS